MKFEEKVVAHIEATGVLAKQASEIVSASEKVKSASAELIPGVVESLAKHGLIGQDEKQAAAELLKDPLKALSLLKSAAEFKRQEAQADFSPGKAAGQTKKAGVRRVGDALQFALDSTADESDRLLGLIG